MSIVITTIVRDRIFSGQLENQNLSRRISVKNSISETSFTFVNLSKRVIAQRPMQHSNIIDH